MNNDVKRKGAPDYSLPGRVIALEKQSAMLLHWVDSHKKRLEALKGKEEALYQCLNTCCDHVKTLESSAHQHPDAVEEGVFGDSMSTIARDVEINKRLKVLEQLIDDFLESRYRMREDIVALQHAATEMARELRDKSADPVLPVPEMGGVAEAGCPITDSLRTTCPHTLDQTIQGSPFVRFGKCGMVFLPIKEALSALFGDGAMLANEKEGGGVASAQEEPFLLDNTSVVRIMDYGTYRLTRLSGGDKCWDAHFEREVQYE